MMIRLTGMYEKKSAKTGLIENAITRAMIEPAELEVPGTPPGEGQFERQGTCRASLRRFFERLHRRRYPPLEQRVLQIINEVRSDEGLPLVS